MTKTNFLSALAVLFFFLGFCENSFCGRSSSGNSSPSSSYEYEQSTSSASRVSRTSEDYVGTRAASQTGVSDERNEVAPRALPETDQSCCSCTCQNCCYQCLSYTCYDCVAGGFGTPRQLALDLLEIQGTDRLLLAGEGTGLDFPHLPEETNLESLCAFDYSAGMVRQLKSKAREFGIPEDNCFEADAQVLPFREDERFDKILFPLSIGSIPDPSLALEEAERVLAVNGKIVILEKLVDGGVGVSCCRKFINFFTNCIFTNVTRSLSQMMEDVPQLKLIQYKSLEGTISGCFSCASSSYRLALLVRSTEYPDDPAIEPRL